ncbi:hypothetical protein ACVW19_000206 [Streptomyces sp. TE5632]
MQENLRLCPRTIFRMVRSVTPNSAANSNFAGQMGF